MVAQWIYRLLDWMLVKIHEKMDNDNNKDKNDD